MVYILAIVIVCAFAFMALYFKGHTKNSRMIREAAHALGLNIQGESFFSLPEIYGKMGPYGIHAGEIAESNLTYFKARLTMHLGMDVKFKIYREYLFGTIRDILGFEDIRIGDEPFDRDFRISSPEPHKVRALLNSDARRIIQFLSWCSEALKITETAIEARIIFSNLNSANTLADFLGLFHETARILDRGADPRKLLMENIAVEAIPPVIAANIEALADNFDMDDGLQGVLLPCLNHESREVQVSAARHLGDAGMAHLAKMLEDKETPAALLGEIVGVIRDCGYRTAATPLGKLYAKTEDAALRVKTIECLGSFGNKKLSPFIVQALEDADSDVRGAAVKALAKSGTVEAVEPLGKFAASTLNPFLKSEIQKAIEAIQAGINTGDRGMLSVSKGDDLDGALSRDDIPGEGALSRHKNSGR